MYALYGIRDDYHQTKIGGPFEREEEKDLVALFTTMSKAIAYVKKAQLKSPVHRSPFGSPKVFRKRSLLGNYDCYEIDTYAEENPPVDPEIKK